MSDPPNIRTANASPVCTVGHSTRSIEELLPVERDNHLVCPAPGDTPLVL